MEKNELVVKWLGFDPEDVANYCTFSYIIGVNPIPQLRNKFPQYKWEYVCSDQQPVVPSSTIVISHNKENNDCCVWYNYKHASTKEIYINSVV